MLSQAPFDTPDMTRSRGFPRFYARWAIFSDVPFSKNLLG